MKTTRSYRICTSVYILLGALLATIMTGNWESMAYFSAGIICATIVMELIREIKARKNEIKNNLL